MDHSLTPSSAPPSKTILKAVLLLWLLVGTLDILSAIVDYYIATGKGPAGIFKYIASAILGNEAFTTGGTEIILLGLFLHYLIAFLFTIFFVFLYIRTNLSLRSKLVVGILYGILIWAIMNLMVVPLSQTPKPPVVVLWKLVKAMLILIFMIGLPLAFLTEKLLPTYNRRMRH